MHVLYVICFFLFSAMLSPAAQAEGDVRPATPAPVSEDGNKGWHNLFEENDFSKWTRPNGSEVSSGWLGGWRIKEGVIERYGLLPGDIVTKRPYRNFELKFEWKISTKGNSGVIYRQRDGKGLEYQILDDTRHSDGETPSHRAASLYDLAAASEAKPLKPAGSWNKGRILADGAIIEHWLNGERVLHVNMESEEWRQRLSESKFEGQADFGRVASPILLQDHLDKVWFQNLWIRELGPSIQSKARPSI